MDLWLVVLNVFVATRDIRTNHQYNERVKNGMNPWHSKSDRFSGRVGREVMDDIGYENCDWISLEDRMSAWKQRFNANNGTKLEMHVPCRDPLDHFMSQCNYRNHNFDCGITDPEEMAKEIHRCLKDEDRFQAKQIGDYSPHIQFKCFAPIPVSRYIEYMAQILQERRVVVTQPVNRETNKKRDKSVECIWNMTDSEKSRLVDAMKEQWDFYDFCEKCMGSENELALPVVKSS
jgi:hypothetical protein